jgi:hypothetical protein
MVHTDDVSILGRGVHTVKESKESIVVAKKEIGLEVRAEETKYIVMSRDKHAGKNHLMNINNQSFERMEQFKYLGTN